MALREITINGQPVLVEVADLTVEGQPADDGYENTSVADVIGDMKDRLNTLVQALIAPVQVAFKTAGAAEWTVEISIGFKGETGVPFIASGEANAAVKVTAKWKQGS